MFVDYECRSRAEGKSKASCELYAAQDYITWKVYVILSSIWTMWPHDRDP